MQKKNSPFCAMLSRMKYIPRWSLMRCARTENLAEHTAETAQLAHVLCCASNALFGGDVRADKVAAAALYHDAPEIITGDLPTPIKYHNPAIREAYRQVEQVAEEKLLGMLPEDLRPGYRAALSPAAETVQTLVRAADKLSAYIKCVEELKAGNDEFRKASQQTMEALKAMNLPELEYFMEHFLPSYRLTLDELE